MFKKLFIALVTASCLFFGEKVYASQFEELTVDLITSSGAPNKDATVKVLMQDSSFNALIATCTTVPSGKAGYARGCMLIKTNDGVVYRNTNTTASCTFSVQTSTTLASAHILVGNGSNVATDVAMSGGATMANTGAITLLGPVNKVTMTAPASGATLTIIDGKTLTVSKTMSFTAADDTGAYTLPTGTNTLLSNALTSAHILVGNGSAVATDVAMSGNVAISNTGATTIQAGVVTRAMQTADGSNKDINILSGTVATTGTTPIYMIAPETGSLLGVDFSCVDAIATDDTNYATFAITNLGQAGAGTTVMLAATDANTTKTTGGSAIVANGKRSLTMSGTATNKNVTAGDRLKLDVISAATLANTLTFPVYCLRFSPIVN